ALPELPVAGPALLVTASYPGASATVVQETIAAPIEQQLNGLEGVLQRFAICTNQGELQLTLIFKKGTDLDRALTLAQNRVAIALPQLPDVVRQNGVSVKKRPVFLLGLALLSPDSSHDREFLARFADQMRDELVRTPAVADVTFLGAKGPLPQFAIHFDREKLAARGLTITRALEVLREQNLQSAGGRLRLPAGQIGQPPVPTGPGPQPPT